MSSQDWPVPEHQVQFARSRAENAREAEIQARKLLDQAATSRAFWVDLVGHLDAKHPANALLTLRRHADAGMVLSGQDDQERDFLRSVQEACESQAKEAAARFGRTFPEAARAAGLQIDATSRHPRYTFERGFIQVEVDERRFTARVAPRDGDETILGLDVEPLVAHLRAEHARLFEREFRPDVLLKSMYRAYLAILQAEGRPEGDEIPLRRLTSRISKNLNRFAADEFNVDLARLIRSNMSVVEGVRLQTNHTRNTRQGMLLHGLEQGGYVGFLSFKREPER